MKPNPTIAVLTTLYNGDAISFAEIALRSIIEQSYPRERIKIYLYVDGPIDKEHQAFLDRWQADIHLIMPGLVNKGLAFGLNALLKSVSDEVYLFRMDLDDVAMPSRLERQVAFMTTNPEIDLLGCNSKEINESGALLFERSYPERHDLIVSRLARCNPMLHPTYCIRAETWRRNPIFYRELYLNEDLGFLFDVVAAGWRLHNLQEALFQWRTGRGFFKRRKFRRSVVEIRIYLAGIWRLWKFTPRLLWPFARFISRLMPQSIAKLMYRSKLRNRLLG